MLGICFVSRNCLLLATLLQPVTSTYWLLFLVCGSLRGSNLMLFLWCRLATYVMYTRSISIYGEGFHCGNVFVWSRSKDQYIHTYLMYISLGIYIVYIYLCLCLHSSEIIFAIFIKISQTIAASIRRLLGYFI